MRIDNPSLFEGSDFENLTVDSGTAFPTGESVGELFFRSDLLNLYVYDGSQWVDTTQSPGSLTGTNHIDTNALNALTTDTSNVPLAIGNDEVSSNTQTIFDRESIQTRQWNGSAWVTDVLLLNDAGGNVSVGDTLSTGGNITVPGIETGVANLDFTNAFPEGSIDLVVSDISSVQSPGITITGGGAVELFHDGSKVFETTSGGAEILGNEIWHAGNFDPSDYAALADDETITGSWTHEGALFTDDVRFTHPTAGNATLAWEDDYLRFRFGGSATPAGIRIDNYDNVSIELSRAGASNFVNGLEVDGDAVWHAGNLTPSDYLPLAGGTMSGDIDANGNDITGVNLVSMTSDPSRDKLRVWNQGSYAIGMASGYTYGYLDGYAMTFQMNDTADRGWWWGTTTNGNGTGSMSLTNDGRLYVDDVVNSGLFYSRGGTYVTTNDTKTDASLVIDSGTAIYGDAGGNYLRNLLSWTSSGPITIGQGGTTLISEINFIPGNAGDNAVKVNGNTVWNAGNFTPSDYLPLTVVDNTVISGGTLRYSIPDTQLTDDPGGVDTLEIFQGTAGADAVLGFHVSGDYAAYFGLDGGLNDFVVGGWSMGGVNHRVFHEGNENHIGTSASTAATVVRRNGSGDISARLFRSEYTSTNASVNYIMTQVETGTGNNYVRPSTIGQFRSAVTDGEYIRTGTGDVKTAGALRFNDSVALNFGTSNDVEFFCNGSHMYTDLNSGIGNWYIRDGSTTRFTFDDAGHFTATGNVTANSDIRLKNNIEPVVDAINKIEQLNGITYNRTDIDDGQRYVGLIAQELETVLPEAVREDDEGIKSVAYGNLAGLFVEAFKEMSAEIKELKAELAELKQ